MHHRSQVCILTLILIIMSAPLPLGWSADSGGKKFHEKVTRPVRDAVDIRQSTQKQEEKWRDEKENLTAVYEQLQAEQEALTARRGELSETVGAARRRVDEKETQLADIAQIQKQIEPFLDDITAALKRRTADDPPFLPEERRQRAERLEEILNDPDAAVSEKFRKTMEALLVEAEYGNTIEVYQQTIAAEGRDMLVNIFRLGRISLFYQSLDRNRCGFYNVARQQWQALPDDHNRAVGAAIDIGAKRKPAELLRLPLGRISVQ